LLLCHVHISYFASSGPEHRSDVVSLRFRGHAFQTDALTRRATPPYIIDWEFNRNFPIEITAEAAPLRMSGMYPRRCFTLNANVETAIRSNPSVSPNRYFADTRNPNPSDDRTLK
jgi:hypothetical protein